MQPVYIYFKGDGTQRYFTAKDDLEAKSFLKEENITEGACLRSIVHIQAGRCWWLPNGITISNTNNLLD
jgi:hypothetical protein